jgi:hypothetical protein
LEDRAVDLIRVLLEKFVVPDEVAVACPLRTEAFC